MFGAHGYHSHMPHFLRYGLDSTLRIDLPPEAVLADCTAPPVVPLDDPSAAVAAALADPIEFPPLAQALVPGDRIALALDHGVPRAASVLAGVVHTLLEAGSPPDDISIVLTKADGESPYFDPLAELPAHVREAVHVVTHDPADRTSLAYLAASKAGKPIYLNRAIDDADVVLPIGCLRLDGALGYIGLHGGLFPAFSDEDTQARFRAPSSTDWPAHQRRRREEADEAAWLLGVHFTLQIVPGPGDTILHILAGESDAVLNRGRQLCEAAWLYRVPRRASLVVATIEGGQDQQTWDNFARALFAASQAVEDDGAIVLCTDLQCEPGPALRRLASPEALDAIHEIRRDRTADAISASLLVSTCERARVYLLSGLSSDVVEELGLGHVDEPEQVDRLSRQHDSCILLANAHHAVLSSQDEAVYS
jgi:hypothetical protein